MIYSAILSFIATGTLWLIAFGASEFIRNGARS